ncbi:hypothetical protein CL631_02215 [bacterium]|nr:hypothetical protein [bacterium]|tara:strand:+ start:2511 stop:2939 length:429 start_codon:yes stop_codon:yes gene_type:complete
MTATELMQEYLSAKDTMTLLKKRVDSLRLRLFEKLDEEGKEDDKGHRWMKGELDDYVLEAKKEKRVSVKLLDDDVLDYLESRNDKELYDSCTMQKTVPDESGIEEAVLDEKIPKQALDSLVTTRESFALKVTRTQKEAEEDG